MIRKLVPLLFVGLSFLLSKCSEDENPNYPIEPYIEFRSIQFIETPAIIDPDTIKLVFYFRDGDDDIGLSGSLEHYDFPYNRFDYYLENGLDEIQKIHPSLIENTFQSPYPNRIMALNPDASLSDKLVTNNTRKKANYNFLPDIGSNGYCWTNYRKEKFLIPESLLYLLDENYDDLGPFGTINNNKTYRVIEDTLYYTSNENHFNLILEFEQSENNNTWTVFDWSEEFCEPSDPFYGRIPPIQGGKSKIENGPFIIKKYNRWEGTIEHNILSIGFVPLFGNKSLRLKFKIKDRQLHDSNTITTPIIDWGN